MQDKREKVKVRRVSNWVSWSLSLPTNGASSHDWRVLPEFDQETRQNSKEISPIFSTVSIDQCKLYGDFFKDVDHVLSSFSEFRSAKT